MGAWLAISGRMSIGEIVLAMSLVMMAVGGVGAVIAQLEAIFSASEAMRSIDEVLTFPPIELNEGKPALPPLEGRVRFEDVWFAYAGNDRPVLKSISLDVAPRQTIALVGPSGAGKTTFINLLLGFYEPVQGRILVDDIAMGTFDRRTLRRQVGIVTQETFLFNGTIWQNITHGLENVAREQVEEAARRAFAHEFITGLQNGYDTEIGDRGLKLSGGQKQRLAIARALLRNPRLLILDEATSALDSQSEKVVQQALEELMAGRTTFVIAHRLSTVRHADRILVFDDGRIVEDGRHDLLVGNKGLYSRLVELQEIG
jgi:ABC-type multidrug transport system fused ATPase/permease subunit